MREGHLPAPARPLAQALIGQAEGLGQVMRAGSPTALPQARLLAGQAEALLASVLWTASQEWPAYELEGQRSLSSGEDFALMLRGSDLVLVWGDSSLSLAFRPSGDCLAGWEGEGFLLTPTACLDEAAFDERARAQDAKLDEDQERAIPAGTMVAGAHWEGAAEESLGGDWLRWLGTAAAMVHQVAPRLGKAAAPVKKQRKSAPEPMPEEKPGRVASVEPAEKHAEPGPSGAASCRHCQAELVAGAKFCSACGKPTAPGCPACGVGVPAHAAFCHECGHAIRS